MAGASPRSAERVREIALSEGWRRVEIPKLAGGRAVSTDLSKPGGKIAGEQILDVAKGLLEQAAAEEEQFDLLEPLTAEETADAQEQLGPKAGPLAVVRRARENRKRGRPAGSRNRRTDDFVAYLQQFGPDPAVVMMKIAGESEEAMIERSRMLDPAKRQLTFGEARAMRIRCAENLQPYFHSKKPVAVDATIRGVMVVEEFGRAAPGILIDQDGEPLGVMRPEGESHD
jgi:hypothetical protein